MGRTLRRILVIHDWFSISRPSRPAPAIRCTAAALTVAAVAGLMRPEWVSAGPAPPLVVDELPAPFEPKEAASAAQLRRQHALALYAAGREYERRGDYNQALRRYQRAFRYDPATTVGFAIIRLAKDKLKRDAEADRYLVRVIETIEGVDAELLRELADYLTKKGRWQKAADLLQRVLESDEIDQGEVPATERVVLHLQIGQLLHLTENYDKAADHFEHVVEALDRPEQLADNAALKSLLIDKAGPTLNLLGDSFLLAGRLDQAENVFRRAHKAQADEGLLGYNLARVFHARKKNQEALGHLQAYFDNQLASEGAAPYRLLAELLEASGQSDQLIPRLEAMRRADEENVPLGYFLALKYRDSDQFDKAAKLAREMLDKAPTISGYRHLVDTYRRQGDHASLLDVLGELVDSLGVLEPLRDEGEAVWSVPATVDALAQTARSRLAQPDAALPYAQRVALALVALEANRPELAEEFFDLAIDARPEATSELLLTWGIKLLVEEQYAAAGEVFLRGTKAELEADDTAEFYYYLAAALEAEGKTDAALEAARKATQLRKDTPRLLSRLAWVQYHGGRYDEAAKAYADIVGRFGEEHDSGEVRQVVRDARLVLSNLAVLEGRLDEAEEWLEQVLDEFPDDVSAMNDLGYLWADADKNLDLALEMIEQAVEAAPENQAYRDSLGWVFYRLGRYGEALVELKKAAAGDDPDPVILDHLGDVYLAVGKPGDAVRNWKLAAKKLEERLASDQPVDHDTASRIESLRAKIARHETTAGNSSARPNKAQDAEEIPSSSSGKSSPESAIENTQPGASSTGK